MSTIGTAAELAECLAPLDEEGRRLVRRYWEQVIREEWEPAPRTVPRAVPVGELDGRRTRRQARRSVAAMVRQASRCGGAEFGPGAA